MVEGFGKWVVGFGGGSSGCGDGILVKLEEMVKWEGVEVVVRPVAYARIPSTVFCPYLVD